MAAAAGAAAVVAGTTFGVAAFADSGPEPTAAVNEAAVPEQGSFVADADNGNEGQADEARTQAEDARAEAADAATSGADASVSQKEEKEDPEPQAEQASSSGSGGGSSSSSGGGESSSSGSSGGGGGSSAPSGSPRDIARGMLGDYGWGGDQFSCLDNLWEKESNWDPSAQNPSSGAYGIPQSLPGDKMASAGSDWQTNPATQIEWGLGYIKDRYGSPCGAWSHSQANNWY
nr:lytic transglycosylase domain-containing protein [Spiractinospora alimapuensis]